MSLIDVALDMIVRYWSRLACKAEMRAWRSTYWPVTSVALVERAVTLPSVWAWATTAPKLAWGTWRVMLPYDGVLDGPPPDWVCVPATNPPSAVARAVNRVRTDSSCPFPTPRSKDPVSSTFEDCPTAPLGRGGAAGWPVAAPAGAADWAEAPEGARPKVGAALSLAAPSAP